MTANLLFQEPVVRLVAFTGVLGLMDQWDVFAPKRRQVIVLLRRRTGCSARVTQPEAEHLGTTASTEQFRDPSELGIDRMPMQPLRDDEPR